MKVSMTRSQGTAFFDKNVIKDRVDVTRAVLVSELPLFQYRPLKLPGQSPSHVQSKQVAINLLKSVLP